MLKGVKYSFLFIASIIVVLHNIIPHVHENELSAEEHIKTHKTDKETSIGFLALAFHEFSEDGQMEDFRVDDDHPSIEQPDYNITLLCAVVTSLFNIELESVTTQTYTDLTPPKQLSGFAGLWSIRPPPFA